MRAACEVPHPGMQVDAAVCTDAANVPALDADLDYGALLVLVVDVERLALALRRLRAHGEHANVKQLAFLAGSSRRQLERQFEMIGLGSPADFVAMMVATDH